MSGPEVKATVTIGGPDPALTIALGTVRAADGAIMTTTGWATMGRAWVTEQQAVNAGRFGWKRAPVEPKPFMGTTLYAVDRRP